MIRMWEFIFGFICGTCTMILTAIGVSIYREKSVNKAIESASHRLEVIAKFGKPGKVPYWKCGMPNCPCAHMSTRQEVDHWLASTLSRS